MTFFRVKQLKSQRSWVWGPGIPAHSLSAPPPHSAASPAKLEKIPRLFDTRLLSILLKHSGKAGN